MEASVDVIVVGGGIWGLSTALHLRLLGPTQVRLLERNSDFGLETTINAAGQVGQIRSSPVITRAIRYGLDFFESFPLRFGFDAGLVRCGSLFVALHEQRLAYFQKQIAVGRAIGLTIDELAPRDMNRFVPGLHAPSILGGYFVHGDGYLDAIQAARSLAHAASAAGADLRPGVRVEQILIENHRAIGVQTTAGPIHARRIIVTAGPWTDAILRTAGLHIPVQAIRHQRVRTGPYNALVPHHPVLRLPDLSSYVRPERGGLTFGHFEANPTALNPVHLSPFFRSSDLDPPIELMRDAQHQIARVYPDIGRLPVNEYCRGMITMAPDGAYAIGPVPGIDGLCVASGCAALGIAGSAAIGKWMAEWAIGHRPSEDLSEFSLDRFANRFADPDHLKESARQAYANYYAIKP